MPTTSRGGRVRVEPSGIELVAVDGETVIQAAWRQGFYWPTVCGGNGTCRTCYLIVVDGARHLSPPARSEREGIVEIEVSFGRRGEQIRLACQARVLGDVVVSKYGVRPLEGG